MQSPHEAVVPIAPQDIEAQLKESIRTALEQSCSKDCSFDEAMHLLDRAWEAQKLLWQLRRNGFLATIKLQPSPSIDPQIILIDTLHKSSAVESAAESAAESGVDFGVESAVKKT